MTRFPLLLIATIALISAACDDGEHNAFTDARSIKIDQRAEGCTPTTIEVEPGETVRLVVKNHTDADYFLGAGDERLRPMIVPRGETKTTYLIGNDEDADRFLRCYADAAATTRINVEQPGS